MTCVSIDGLGHPNWTGLGVITVDNGDRGLTRERCSNASDGFSVERVRATDGK